jgi:hypothetical protein
MWLLDRFVLSHFLYNNMKITIVTPAQSSLSEDENEFYKFHLKHYVYVDFDYLMVQ